MTCFADQACSVQTEIVENVSIARNTMRLRFRAPAMAQRVTPGQFFMVRNPAGNDPLIGRAFALYDVASDTVASDTVASDTSTSNASAGWIDVVYVVKGKLTSSLVQLTAGAPLAVWGPLGNGFAPPTAEHLIMVAGGIGQTPFLALAKEALGRQEFGQPGERLSGGTKRVSLVYGVRSAEYLAGVEAFKAAGVDVQIATEDGSIGPPRRVTDLLAEVLDDSPTATVVCCGPEAMMEAVAQLTASRQVDCQVSLETPMACGIGICFTCVAKVGNASDWDYKRTCVEGPVFNARDIVWS